MFGINPLGTKVVRFVKSKIDDPPGAFCISLKHKPAFLLVCGKGIGDGGYCPYNEVMIRPPESSEHDPYYAKYISLVHGDDLTAALDAQIGESLATLRAIPDEKSLHRYAPGKWSIKETLGHL